MVRMSIFVWMAALLTGCAGSVNGKVADVSLNVADAIFAVLKADGKSIATVVVLSDKPKLCETFKANREPKSATALITTLFRFSDSAYLAPEVGDYTVVGYDPTTAGSYAQSFFSRTDANCTNTISVDASRGKSGLIKLTAFKDAKNGTAGGNFDITFGEGDRLTGSFNASYCDISELPQSPNCE